MSASINAIFDAGDYFLCEKYSCRMLISACIARQKNSQSRASKFTNKPGGLDYNCRDCEQGKKNMEQVSVLGTKKSKPVGLVCKKPDCIHKGEIQPFDNFFKHKGTISGYEGTCKDCRRKKAKESYQKRVAIKQKKKKTADKTPEVNKIMKKESEFKKTVVKVDFSNYQDIYDDLLKSAIDEFRGPEMQILFLLKKVLTRPRVGEGIMGVLK